MEVCTCRYSDRESWTEREVARVRYREKERTRNKGRKEKTKRKTEIDRQGRKWLSKVDKAMKYNEYTSEDRDNFKYVQ